MAIQFAKAFGARIELLHAYDFGQWVTLAEVTFVEVAVEKIRLAAAKKLRPLVDRAKKVGVEVSTHLALGTASQVIAERAEEKNFDLIVMGTRGLGTTKYLLLGSVAERTVRTAACPVLTVAADR